LAQLVAQNTQLINMMAQNQLQQQQQQGRGQQGPRECSYADFEGTHPPVFTAATDPLDADHWIRTMESKFGLLDNCTEQQKARFAAQMLQGPAGTWYATFLDTQLEGHVVTWTQFHNAFRGHYIPETLMMIKCREFET